MVLLNQQPFCLITFTLCVYTKLVCRTVSLALSLSFSLSLSPSPISGAKVSPVLLVVASSVRSHSRTHTERERGYNLSHFPEGFCLPWSSHWLLILSLSLRSHEMHSEEGRERESHSDIKKEEIIQLLHYGNRRNRCIWSSRSGFLM